jgi:hypothetical protein
VELSAVALDDEPPVHQQIYPAHSVDAYLELDAASKPEQHESDECLRTRLGSCVHKRTEASMHARQGREHVTQVLRLNQSQVKRAVESRHGHPRRLASARLDERIDHIDYESFAHRRARPPVCPHMRPAQRQTRVISLELHVELVRVRNENAELA